ncbi:MULTISPECIES: GNAT family N-acetyltransferase [unclassified Paludibacterium]|uniref:GNAT family N-acetyltransferase n=1 Tax=unclassified Paludibacterium TaxID=2618429 RepID=UPI001C045D2A|nr:GNAT family N-acetyltransferase [Paludibacterium sp. B53371]BEV72303.1 GNAT family N-acetyltransferase [Paludibacterium sp. THUN1379]
MTPILLDFPDHFATERLLVRAPRPGDGAALFAAVSETLPDLRAWPASLPWAQHEPSPQASEQFCRNGHAAFLARSDLPMLMFLQQDHQFVGCCGLHRLDWSVPKAEIGYWCRKRFHHQGLVSEAVTGLVQFAFEHLAMHRLEIQSDAANQASRAVAERCRFALEGIMRHERKTPTGELRDTCLYAFIR